MRILRAPAAVEDAADTATNSPGSITSAWVRDTKARFSAQPEPPAPPPPKKETDGKTDSGDGRVPEQPVKPVVGSDPVPAAPAAEAKLDAAKGAEAKPDPAKAAAPDDWETAPVPKGIPAKDFEAWKKGRKESETKLKAEIKAREDKLAEIESKLAEAQNKTNGELPPEVKGKMESQEREIEQLRTALMEADVTKDLRWKNYFEGGKARIIERAKKAVGSERAAEIEQILKLKDEDYRRARLDQFLGETDSSFVVTQLNIQLDKLAGLDDEEANELKKVQEHNQAKASEKQTKAEQDKLAQIESFNKTLKEISDPEKGFLPYQKRPDDPAWNEDVDRRTALVKSLLTGQGNIKPETIIRGAFDAAAMPLVLQSYQASLKQWETEKAELEAKIQAFTAAQPGPGTAVAEEGDPNRVKLTPDMDPGAATKAFAQRAARMARGQ